MTEPSKIEKLYFSLINGEISIENFEQIVYGENWIEEELNEDEYINLISLNFKIQGIKHEIKKILRNKINYQSWGMNKVILKFKSMMKKNLSWEREYEGLYNFKYYLRFKSGEEILGTLECPYEKRKVIKFDKILFEKRNNETAEKFRNSFPSTEILKNSLEEFYKNKKLVFYFDDDLSEELSDKWYQEEKEKIRFYFDELNIKIEKKAILEKLN